MVVMEAGHDQIQDQRAWVSPSLIEANYILSLSRLELQDVIAAELDANPALEVEDRPTCPACGTALDGSTCPICLAPPQTNRVADDDLDIPDRLISSQSLRDDADEYDPFSFVAEHETLQEMILRDARTILDPPEFPIAEYLVDAIDERGFLDCTVEEAARQTGAPPETVLAVIEVIQEVAPVGVGARDLRESLLLQLDYLERSGQDIPVHVRPILESALEAFGAHKYGQIAKDLGVTTDEIEEARDFIRTHLSPYPLQAQQAKWWQSPSQATYVSPDVIISIRDGELHVEVVDISRSHVRLNPLYEQIANEIGRRKTPDGKEPRPENGRYSLAKSTSADERDHVRLYTNRAKMFVSNLNQRRETLLKISQCICELQEPFLRGGVRELRPLTRAVVAQQVGVHESTVSRATADKYVMLPSRKVIPFSDFFTPSLSTKDVIKELIVREQKEGKTLTDRQICDALLEQGIRIARRTVAKYRSELRILPSTMR